MGAWAGNSKHALILGAKVRILNRRRHELSDSPIAFLHLGGKHFRQGELSMLKAHSMGEPVVVIAAPSRHLAKA